MNTKKVRDRKNLVRPAQPICERQLLEQSHHIAIVCSRLGYASWLHRHVGLCLVDCARRTLRDGSRWLIAKDSAVSPWAIRAAQLFQIPYTTLSHDTSADFRWEPSELFPTCDEAVIGLADEVEAVFVRRGGRIENGLCQRIGATSEPSTFVFASRHPRCAAKRLIKRGAVGRYLFSNRARESSDETECVLEGFNEHPSGNWTPELHPNDDDRSWTASAGEWLLHCTRGCRTNWPGESVNQYRDTILLGDESHISRGPLQTLRRILRSGYLLANAQTSKHGDPVVCFSALPLLELLERRCYRAHLGRWDYEPFGIAIRRSTAERIGIRSVIYGEPHERSSLPASQRFRFHPKGRTHDWREEHEWRSPLTVDLKSLPKNDVRVFAAIQPFEVWRWFAWVPWRITCL